MKKSERSADGNNLNSTEKKVFGLLLIGLIEYPCAHENNFACAYPAHLSISCFAQIFSVQFKIPLRMP
jgi:hypothetical protein